MELAGERAEMMHISHEGNVKYLLNQEQASEMDWTFHTDLWKSENSRGIKK